MSEVSGTSGFYSAPVQVSDENLETGTVSFGGVNLSAVDAAQFVMLHRTQVIKKVGADRTEMAQRHLELAKTARHYESELTDIKSFIDTDKSWKHRAPTTPDMIDFLKNEVGCSPGEYVNRVLFYGSAVSRLPESVRDYYGMQVNPDGTYDNQHRSVKPQFAARAASGHGQYEIHGVTCLPGDRLDSLKEEVNNYIDQLSDSNNLFMTKFKSVVSNMNEALEGANSMADKTHDTIKGLLSRW